ncbi:hypothetical protein CBW18_18150 [Pedobacter sp. AJM]|nr:hypothetical protein CBW18_18150 [Pedobacter sp. AJM]
MVRAYYIINNSGKPRGILGIRFWKKDDRSKGSVYIQLPAIYLSLKRILPIGEDNVLKESDSAEFVSIFINIYNQYAKELSLAAL